MRGSAIVAAFVVSMFIATQCSAGALIVNGQAVGILKKITVEYVTNEKSETVTFDYSTNATGDMVVDKPASVEMQNTYPTMTALYKFVKSVNFAGAVFVNGKQIHAGNGPRVDFVAQPDGSVRRQ